MCQVGLRTHSEVLGRKIDTLPTIKKNTDHNELNQWSYTWMNENYVTVAQYDLGTYCIKVCEHNKKIDRETICK